MTRWPQIVLIGSTLLASWLGMQAVHELGHVAGAWLTGGRVERVVLDPRTISRTDLALNPSPLIVVWAGPIFGVAAPLLLWGTFAATRHRSAWDSPSSARDSPSSARVSRPRRFADRRSPRPQGDISTLGDLRSDERGSVARPATTDVLPGAFLLRFFAGFCLVANGLYIGVGSFGSIGDCGEMLRHGAAAWQLWLFGTATVPAGIWLWNGIGPHFGFGPAQGRVSPGAAYGTLIACAALLLLGFIVGGG